jgi:hypothetical protein
MLTQIIIAAVMLAACWLLVTVFQSDGLPALQRTNAAHAPRPPPPRNIVPSDAAAEAWENEGGALRGRS